jgi:hypothetical protein
MQQRIYALEHDTTKAPTVTMSSSTVAFNPVLHSDRRDITGDTRNISDKYRRPTVQLSACILDKVPALKGGRQLDFPCEIKIKTGFVKGKCLTDTGASGIGFVNSGFVRNYNLDKLELTQPVNLRLADGQPVDQIKHVAQVKFRMGDHWDSDLFYVTPLGGFDMVLGMPWLEQHDPSPRYGQRTMTFDSDYCLRRCLLHHRPVTVRANGAKQEKDKEVKKWPDPSGRTTNIAEVSAYAFICLAGRKENQVIALHPEDFEALDKPPDPTFTTDVAAISPEDYEKFFEKIKRKPWSQAELQRMIPKQYHKYLHVWDPQGANKLPPHRSADHRIDLAGGSIPKRRTYGLSRDQTAVVKEYVEEMLGKGFIRPSSSPYAAPVLVVKKPEGGLRVCVDYRALNALTIKNRNAPPLIRETITRLCKAKIYTKLDVIAAFNEIRIREGDEEKTALPEGPATSPKEPMTREINTNVKPS